jgi:hypothetical protein
MKNLALVFLSSLLLGCMNPAAKGPFFTQIAPISNEVGSIYFYRPDLNDGATVCLNVFFNERNVGCLGSAGYLNYDAKPGAYKIQIKPDAFPTHTLLEFNLEVVAGEGRLLRYSTEYINLKNVVAERYTAFGSVYIESMLFKNAASTLSGLRNSVAP